MLVPLLGSVLSFQALSFLAFVCFAASSAAAFVTVPLLEFLAALFFLFAYSTKFNERFKGFLWPLAVRQLYCWHICCCALYDKRKGKEESNNLKCDFHVNNIVSFLSQDFLRCVTASIIYFIISIISVSKHMDGSSKAAGVKLNPAASHRFLHQHDLYIHTHNYNFVQ